MLENMRYMAILSRGRGCHGVVGVGGGTGGWSGSCGGGNKG